MYKRQLLGVDSETIELAMKDKLDSEENIKLEKKKRGIKGRLIISSATVKPKTKRLNLFTRLLGFEIQKTSSTLRNIIDVMERIEGDYDSLLLRSIQLIKKFGSGGLLFIPLNKGKEWVEKTVEILNKNNIPSISYDKFNANIQKKFEKGEIKIVVGISNTHNPLVRGIDLPHAIKYAIFAGVPKLIFPIEFSIRPSYLFSLLLAIRPVVDEKEKIDLYLRKIRNYLNLKEEKLIYFPRIKKFLEEVSNFIQFYFSKEDFKELIVRNDEVGLIEEDGKLYIIVADATSYIQASGRTSRLYPGGITKGLSYVLVNDGKAERSLKRKIKLLNPDIKFFNPEELNFEKIIEEISSERELLKRIREEEKIEGLKDVIKSSIVIVESPTKAKTIANFFGLPSKKWIEDVLVYEINIGNRIINIIPTLGHITDLVVRSGIYGIEKINGKLCPVYSTIKIGKDGEAFTDDNSKITDDIYDKFKIIKALRELSLEVDEIFIATDPDSEGEKIAWDVYLSIKPYNQQIKRAEFHEITRKSFLKAIENPRDIDFNLVKAQITRRIADRLVGFYLSQELQRKFKNKHLSAGRVQSPVLGWILNREEERKKKKAIFNFKIKDLSFNFEIEDINEARKLYKSVTHVDLRILERKEEEVNPFPPFTTDTLLTECSERFHFSTNKTMEIAQELFEKGLITYHRTDSSRVSDAGIKIAEEYIKEKFSSELFNPRTWKTIEGAHECIRPTRALDTSTLRFMLSSGLYDLKNIKDSLRIYDLIFKRFIASQMKRAVIEVVKLKIKIGNRDFEKIINLSLIHI